MFLKISQNSLEKSLPEPFFNKVAGCNFIKKEALAQVFSCGFCEMFKNTFFTEHSRTTASEIHPIIFLHLPKQTLDNFCNLDKNSANSKLISRMDLLIISENSHKLVSVRVQFKKNNDLCLWLYLLNWSSRWQMFFNIGVLKNLSNFTGSTCVGVSF